MRATRRRLIAGAAGCAAAAFGRRPAGAAEFTYRMGAELPISHPAIVYALQAAVKIKRVTDGRVELQVFPNNSLGSGANLLQQVRLGAIELLQAGDNVLGSLAHDAFICTVPFAFTNMQAALKAMDGPLGKRARAAVAKIGLYPFAKSWPVGIRQVCNNIRPINAPSDFNGLKIRTPDDPIEVAFFRALGATPTPSIPTNQNYLALQTHLVDGADTPISAMEALKLYEVQKYVSYTNHSYVEFTTVANADAWQRLPANLRAAVDASINESALGYRIELAKLEATLETTMKAQGMIFNHPSTDLGTFRAIISRAGIYAKLRDDYGPEIWDLLERSVGKLT